MKSDRIATAEAEARLAADRRRVERDEVSAPVRCWSARRPGPLVLVHRLTANNTAGIPVCDVATAHRVRLSAAPPTRREWRRLIEQADVAIRPLIRGTAIAFLPHASIARRITVIRERLMQRRTTELQRSLFDGRADAVAREREQIIGLLDGSLARIAAAIASPVDVEATQVELIAAWSERVR